MQFLLQGLIWAALGLWTQNHPQVVGLCPGHGPQLIAQSRPSKKYTPYISVNMLSEHDKCGSQQPSSFTLLQNWPR